VINLVETLQALFDDMKHFCSVCWRCSWVEDFEEQGDARRDDEERYVPVSLEAGTSTEETVVCKEDQVLSGRDGKVCISLKVDALTETSLCKREGVKEGGVDERGPKD